MKLINISTEDGMNKFAEVINEVQKRSKVRTVTAEEIKRCTDKVFERLNITKKALNGVKAIIDLNAQTFPSAYKYEP